MNLRYRKVLFIAVALFALPSLSAAQSQPAHVGKDDKAGNAVLDPGVVVEEVTPGWGASQAGIQAGDVLLTWSRDDAKGTFESPFDVTEAEIQQGPRGSVVLGGLRGNERMNWSLGPDSWAIKCRPVFSNASLSVYRQGRDLANAGEWSQAMERWQAIAGQSKDAAPQWLSPWLFFQAARLQAEARDWNGKDDACQLALRHASASPPPIRAQIMRACALAFEQRSDWAGAEKYYQQAIDLDSSPLQNLALALDLNNLGHAVFQKGDLPKAGEYHRHSLEIRTKLVPGSIAVALSMNNLGEVLYYQGDLVRAESYEQQALRIGETLAPGSLAFAAIVRNLGDVASDRGDLDNAEKYYRRALEMREKLVPRSLEVARTWHNVGSVTLQRGDLDGAEKYFLQALQIRRTLSPDGLDVARSLGALGSLAWHRGDIAKAQDYNLQALAIKLKLVPGSLDVAYSLTSLGLVAYTLGDLAKAEEFHLQSLAIKQRLGPDSIDVAASFNNLGLVAWQRGDYVKAERYHRQSLMIRQKLAPDSLDVATSLNNLSVLAWQRGDLAKAEEYSRQSLKIRQKLAPDSMAVAMSFDNLGLVLLEHGSLAEAEEYSRESLAIHQRLAPGGLDVARSFNNLGLIARQRGNLVQAEQYFQNGLDIREKYAPGSIDMFWNLKRLGDVTQDQGQLEKAEQFYRRAFAASKKIAPGSMNEAESLAALGSVLRKTGKLDLAAQSFEQALGALDSQADRFGGSQELRADFRGRYERYYKQYADLLISQHKFEAAFEVVERSRARTLLETLATAQVNIRKGADPALLDRQRNLQAVVHAKSERRIRLLGDKESKDRDVQVKQVEKEIAGMLAELQDVESQLRSSSPGYAALTQPQPLTAKQFQQQLLDPGTLLLEYSLGEERSYVFAVTPNSLQAFELPKRAEIERAARRVYDLLTVRNRPIKGESEDHTRQRWAQAETDYPAAAAELSRIVLGPIAGHLGNKRLLIVADGALQYIPFAMMPKPVRHSPAVNAHRQPTPLVVSHEIVNLPSASVLAVLRQEAKGRKPAPKAVAVLADPVFDLNDGRLIAITQPRGPGVQPANIANTRGDGPSADASPTAPTPAVAPAPANVGAADLLQYKDQNKDKAAADPLAGLLSDDLLNDAGSTSAHLLTRSAGDLGLSRDGQLNLPRLLFSRQEADAIRAVTRADRLKEAVDFQASRAAAMDPELRNYRIVHFATHGLLNSEHPELSGLVFSLVDEHGQPQDGFLQLQDIYNLDLPADLVVLSACETGLGKEINGEGLIGLTRGFMYAGASRVVASLWNVSDAATASLMAEFYRAMEKDRMPPAAALRAAQIHMLQQKRWNSPYYWAAFQIQGEWK